MAFDNKGADVALDNMDLAYRPNRRLENSEDNEVEDRDDKSLDQDQDKDKDKKDKKSTSKLAGMLDANVYATKKTIAQGMLDVALLTANASQLKYLLQVGKAHEFYYLMMSLICISIILQIVVGVFFIVIGYLNVNEPKDQRAANILNNIITVSIFLIAAVNIVISSFGMKSSDSLPAYSPIT